MESREGIPMNPETEEHMRQMLEFAKKKQCAACMGTGKVINMDIEEECPLCDDGYYEDTENDP